MYLHSLQHRGSLASSLLIASDSLSRKGDHLVDGQHWPRPSGHFCSYHRFCLSVGSLKNLCFLDLTHGRVCLAASTIPCVMSYISSSIEDMLSCIELMSGLTTSDTTSWKRRVAPEKSALVQSIRKGALVFSMTSVGMLSLTGIGR